MRHRAGVSLRGPRLAGVLAALVGSVLVAAETSRASVPLVAAARGAPRSVQQRLLGPWTSVPVLRVRPGGALTWSSVPSGSVWSLEGSGSVLSVGDLRHTLLDESVARSGAASVQARFGLRGRGVAVGVVDTGCDVRHADLRGADGRTRVAWLLDLSRTARGVHPDLEARFGFARDDGARYGAVYSAADLDALLAAEQASGQRDTELPVDEVGHGTYVASIAAGNGRATGEGLAAGRYVGMAPEASLIVVRANAPGSARFNDASLVAGVAFALDRAEAMGLPVVVNLSAGSHYGTHDGGSALERALAALVGRDTPGRALVLAAGNDGEAPVHARLDVLPGVEAEFSVAVPDGGADDVAAIEVVYEGAAEVAVRWPGGASTPFVAMGAARSFATDEGVASVGNATDATDAVADSPALTPGERAHTATVLLSGDSLVGHRRAGGRYAVRVRGRGVVHGYIADPGAAGPGATFASATLATGTVVVPATSPAVITVGAVASRLRWPRLGGGTAVYSSAAGFGDLEVGVVAPFSSVGPNRVNAPRPDILAPGAFVVAAMSAQAAPSVSTSVFRDGTGGATSVLVADDGVHAASAGSSAAAPHVTGAIALLLQGHPRATQDELRAALTAGARGTVRGGARWGPAEGWGELAVEGALAALDAAGVPSAVDLAQSEVNASVAALGEGEPCSVLVRLVDTAGTPAQGAVVVRVAASAGTFDATPSALGGGRFEARWRAEGVAAGTRVTLHAWADGRALAQTAEVQVRRSVANGDAGTSARGGCAVARHNDARRDYGALLASITYLLVAHRGRRRRARRGPLTGRY